MADRRHSSALPLGLLAVLVYLFLYAPILVLAVLSFSASRLAASWGGFTFGWYVKAAQDPAVLASLRNSLIVGVVASAIATTCGTVAALALHRHRFRGSGVVDAAILLPTVVPEIVLAASLLLLFATLGAPLGFTTVILAHVGFTISYAFVVVKARIAGFDRTLEEAAMDLGAGPVRTFVLVTLPAIAPAVLAGGLLAFALSIDDYVVTSFVTGVGATTLPLQIYSMVKSGISPEINAVSTVLILATGLLLVAAFLLEQGRSIRTAAIPAVIGLTVLAAPFFAVGGPVVNRDHELNLFIWSNYIAPETLAKFERRYGVKVNVDFYDSNESLLAKLQAGNTAYDVICPSDYTLQVLIRQGLVRRIDHARLPHLRSLSPSFLDRPYDPGNAHSTPYFWGTTGIAYDRTRVVEPIDSWAALWDERYRGRILMLDDPREAFMAALKLRGHSLNTTDPQLLREARDLLVQQRRLVRTYNSSNYEDVLLARDVWIAQGWSGQFAKAMEQDPDIVYVVPREGSTLFIDNLAIPTTATHLDLAHTFLDFVMEPEVAAEICRTMHYSTTSREALALLPSAIRNSPAMFPPPTVFDRLEMIRDLGDTTVLYDRLWTEIKSAQ